MIVLSSDHIRSLLSMSQCIDLMKEAMLATSSGESVLPLRWGMELPNGGLMGMMPGYSPAHPCFGLKVVNIMPTNHGTERSSHNGAMMLFDSRSGDPLVVINAADLTAIRTAAASALATDILARKDASVLTLIGTGEQAASHLESMCTVRSFKEIRVCSSEPARAEKFVEENSAGHLHILPYHDVSAAMTNAHVVCTMRGGVEPFLTGDMLEPGMHVNLVGASTPDQQEADPDVVILSQFFTDYIASATAQAAELITARQHLMDNKAWQPTEIGAVIAGRAQGRTSDDRITVYRSLGVASQDLAAAWYLYEQAREQGIGSAVDF